MKFVSEIFSWHFWHRFLIWWRIIHRIIQQQFVLILTITPSEAISTRKWMWAPANNLYFSRLQISSCESNSGYWRPYRRHGKADVFWFCFDTIEIWSNKKIFINLQLNHYKIFIDSYHGHVGVRCVCQSHIKNIVSQLPPFRSWLHLVSHLQYPCSSPPSLRENFFVNLIFKVDMEEVLTH